VGHLRESGFRAEVRESGSHAELAAHREGLGVGPALASCHTAVVGPYVVEGHVPGEVIMDLLAEAPDVVGLSVPGMPAGSPGMESPHPVSYDVLALQGDGTTRVYTRRQGRAPDPGKPR